MKNESHKPHNDPQSYNAELNNELFEIANQPREEDDFNDQEPKNGWSSKRVLAFLAAIVVIALLALGIFNALNKPKAPSTEEPTVSRNANPGIDGTIARGMPVSQLQVGDCIRDFQGPLEKADVVTCTTEHNAQLIGVPELENEPDTYPGNDSVSAKGLEACKAITLNVASLGTADWRYEYSRPSKETWGSGDRQIACFLKSEGSNTRTSLMPTSTTAPKRETGAASSSAKSSNN